MAVLCLSPAAADALSGDLWALGAGSVEQRSCAVPGMVELWVSLGRDLKQVFASIRSTGFSGTITFEVVDSGTAHIGRRWAQPTWVADDLVIVPAWLEDTFDQSVTVIPIDPGESFGLGGHPTTLMMVRQLLVAITEGVTVLDVGCGTGVLGIVACVFGASRVEAIDIFESAVESTHSNARANGVADRIHASTTPLADVIGRHELVLCNTYDSLIVDFATDLRRILAPGGTLIVSGVRVDHQQEVIEALRPLRLTLVDVDLRWAALTFRA
jgi:ribosomal protein L11 methyltransferase